MHIPDKTKLKTLDSTMNKYTRWPAPYLNTGVDTKIQKIHNDKTDPET